MEKLKGDNFYNFRPILMKFCMEVTNRGIQLKRIYGIAGPCLNHPTHSAHPPKNHLNDKLWQFWLILMKLGQEV